MKNYLLTTRHVVLLAFALGTTAPHWSPQHGDLLHKLNGATDTGSVTLDENESGMLDHAIAHAPPAPGNEEGFHELAKLFQPASAMSSAG